MNWIGAVCIVCATTIIGWEMSKSFRERPNQLRQLKVCFQMLESEIVYGLVPLHDAFEHISGQAREPLAQFFKQLAEGLSGTENTVRSIWEQELKNLKHHSFLKDKELEVLRQFGTSLGQQDKEQQQRQIQLALTHLSREEQEARDLQTRYEKVFRSLGLLTGLLIAILLL